MDMGVGLVPLNELTRTALAPETFGLTAKVHIICTTHTRAPEKLLWVTGTVMPRGTRVKCSDGRERYVAELLNRCVIFKIREDDISEVSARDQAVPGDLLAVFRACGDCRILPFRLTASTVARLGSQELTAADLRGGNPLALSPSAHGIWLVRDYMSRPIVLEELCESEWVWVYRFADGKLFPRRWQYRRRDGEDLIFDIRGATLPERVAAAGIGKGTLLFRTRSH